MPLVKANTARWSEFNNQRSPFHHRDERLIPLAISPCEGETPSRQPARCRRYWDAGVSEPPVEAND